MNCDPLMREALSVLTNRGTREGDFVDTVHRNDYNDLIEGYTQDDYIEINKSYREGETTYKTEQFDELFATEGNYDGVSFRAAWMKPSKIMEIEEGMVIQNEAILSTTKSSESLMDYLDIRSEVTHVGLATYRATRPRKELEGVVLVIDNERYPQYDITEFSAVPEEEEVLIAPKSLLHVIGVREVDGVKHIDMIQMDPRLEDIVMDARGKVEGRTGMLGLAALAPTVYEEKNKEK